MKKVTLRLVISLLVWVLIAGGYVQSEYHFNPFTFDNLGIKTNYWYEYKKPIVLELEFWDEKPPTNYRVDDEELFEQFYKELADSKEAAKEDFTGSSRWVWIFARYPEQGNIHIHLDINENGIGVLNDKYIEVSDDLIRLIEEIRVKENKIVD